MAKRQTRRTVSLNGKLYRRAKQYAEEQGLPLTQIVEQAIETALAARPVVRRAVPRIYPAATCACCIEAIPAGTVEPIMVPWGRGDAMVRICEGCSAGGQAAAL